VLKIHNTGWLACNVTAVAIEVNGNLTVHVVNQILMIIYAPIMGRSL